MKLTLSKNGSREYQKLSFPVHTGIYSELETDNYVFQFNCNNEILRLKGKGRSWPHPHEWVKRNLANDWIYYSTGGYTGVFESTGEYYLPNFCYSTTNLLGGKPFDLPEVKALTDDWHLILEDLYRKCNNLSSPERDFFKKALHNTPEVLAGRGADLHAITDGPVSVLPPDARHVDYDIIPLPISRGCLYKCRFCKVKNHQPFAALETTEVQGLADRLVRLLANDLGNYNSVFLGDHDALEAGEELICFAAEHAYSSFRFAESYCRGNSLFLFGSVASLLNAPQRLFLRLSEMPYQTFINIGLESADQQTLDKIGKPITALDVESAFSLMQEINQRYQNIELTANFIMDDDLPKDHYPSILRLIRDSLSHQKPKGSIYFSPLSFSSPSRAKLFDFHRLKVLSRLPTFLYIIQRL